MLEGGNHPWEVLGVGQEASPEQVRAAYLALVKQYPPDQAPERFERIRDAYDQMRDPRIRMRQMLHAGGLGHIASLLDGAAPRRVHVGPGPWLEALREETGKR